MLPLRFFMLYVFFFLLKILFPIYGEIFFFDLFFSCVLASPYIELFLPNSVKNQAKKIIDLFFSPQFNSSILGRPQKKKKKREMIFSYFKI